MAALDDALTALQTIQTDDADVQTQVSNALAAVQAAQAAGGTTVVEDPTWTAVQAALTANGWSPPVPAVVPPVEPPPAA